METNFLFREIFIGFLRDVQKCRHLSLSLHRGPVGEQGGGSVAGTFESKEKVYLGPFLGPIGHFDFKSGGPLELQ
jgi:hypothetical protein